MCTTSCSLSNISDVTEDLVCIEVGLLIAQAGLDDPELLILPSFLKFWNYSS